MEHLSTLDAGFLQAEDSDPHISLAVGALAVLAGIERAVAHLASSVTSPRKSVPRRNRTSTGARLVRDA